MKKLLAAIGAALVLFCAPAHATAEQFHIDIPLLPAQPHMNGEIDDTWKGALKIPVTFDFMFARDGEPVSAYVAQDASGLDVAFDVTQRAAITATQQTNGNGVMHDDTVGVRLWPQGTNGFGYGFYSNPAGARYETSSENTAYSPEWTAVGRRTAHGYVVTMHVPFNVIRSGGSTTWRMQFVRNTIVTNSLEVWEHQPGQRNWDDPAYAGVVAGIAAKVQAAAGRPKPRLQLYALGEATTPANGGSTSRIGGDFSLPVTRTSSFVGAFHPDYSNVESDQQTIAPSAFVRQYREVRPFFTQTGSFFNNYFNCTDCPSTLYTPSIPTFRQAYAYEGTQGPFSFAAFNASGMDGRSDNAEVVTYSVMTDRIGTQASVQRVGVAMPGFRDTVTEFLGGIANQRSHLFLSYNGAVESGTGVTNRGEGIYSDFGAGFADKTSVAVVDVQKVGSQFNPADGFVQQNDLHGLVAFFQKTFNISPNGAIHDVSGDYIIARYHNAAGQLNSTLSGGHAILDFKDQFSLKLTAFSQGIQIYDGEFLPFNQNGLTLSYKGSSSTPTSVSYGAGSYFHGRLVDRQYLTTLPLARRLKLALEGDEVTYDTSYSGERNVTQWLQRASLDWQFSRFAAFDVGARRIFGGDMPVAYQPIDFTRRFSGGNVTAAFHFLAAQNEFYAVYGDANSFSTTPALYLKWIRYIGAQKGT